MPMCDNLTYGKQPLITLIWRIKTIDTTEVATLLSNCHSLTTINSYQGSLKWKLFYVYTKDCFYFLLLPSKPMLS